MRVTRAREGLVLEVIRELIGTHGVPGYIRSDNGPEFIAKTIKNPGGLT